jgi:hypothetical protein
MADGEATAVRRVGRLTAWIALSVLLTLLTGCKGEPKSQPPPPPKVTVAQPVRQVVTDNLDLTGNTQAIYTVQLVARVGHRRQPPRQRSNARIGMTRPPTASASTTHMNAPASSAVPVEVGAFAYAW